MLEMLLNMLPIIVLSVVFWGALIWGVIRIAKAGQESKQHQLDGLTEIIKLQQQQTEMLETILKKID